MRHTVDKLISHIRFLICTRQAKVISTAAALTAPAVKAGVAVIFTAFIALHTRDRMREQIRILDPMHTVLVWAKDNLIASLLRTIDADVVATVETRAVFAMIHLINAAAFFANVAPGASIVVRIFDILHPVVGAAIDV